MTLVILAAGLGSRFGGLKQVEGVGPNNEFIIDYSIYDAIQSGFTKVVMIIKEENFEIFKDTIGSRWEDKIRIEYAFQSNKGIEHLIPKDRVKPLGTLHALVCAKDYIDEDFAILNADDFYGRDAFMKASEFLKSSSPYCASLPYILKNTLSLNGGVNRGICVKNEEGYLTHIDEELKIQTDGEKIFNENREFTGEEIASMNFFCIKKDLISFFEEEFKTFLETKDLSKDECYVPVALSNAVEKGKTKIKVVEVNSKWHGITNREDLSEIKDALKKYVEEGIYPNSLI
ncbi:MAG: nucleotidyltransferase [Bacilli bacterium]|nr:nucleotidyltransferase [Bacilli bacterium]